VESYMLCIWNLFREGGFLSVKGFLWENLS